MTRINDPDNCLDRLFLANVIPAPIPSGQYAVRWGEFAPALCKLLARIEKLENELAELRKGTG